MRYEPQFSYTMPQPLLELTLTRCGYSRAQVQDKYVPHALKVLNTLLQQYGSYERYMDRCAGDVLQEPEARAIVDEYLAMTGADGDVNVIFNPSMVGNASFEKKSSRLSIRSQGLRRNVILGTLHHEIGTHYLREKNDRKQPWAREVNGRKKYMLEDKNPTEEGLASLHTVLEREGHVLWRAALLYYCVWRALQLSFRELYDDLAQFLGDSLDERWDYCVRAKRGLLDTSQTGGFAKDQMYLAGAMEILERRHRINFLALYAGKLSVADAHRVKATGLARTDNLKLPVFLRGSERMARYRAMLDEIVKDNGLTELIDGPLNRATPSPIFL